jgi:luciferase family oxidoreductase group 1
VVAEHVAALEALHPGRIDLGIGRAPGTNQETALALRRSFHLLGAEDFPRDLLDLMGLLGDVRGESGLWQHFAATPAATSTPQILLLGSSDFSARLAGRLGLPFVFAHHFDQGGTLEAVALYREAFRPSPALDEPFLIVTASVLVAETDEAAAWEAGPAVLMVHRIRQGRFAPLVSPEEAAAHADTAAARAMPSNRIVGAPGTAVAHLDDLVAATGADEIMVNNVAHSLGARMRSLELLAGAWGSALPAAPVDELVEGDPR